MRKSADVAQQSPYLLTGSFCEFTDERWAVKLHISADQLDASLAALWLRQASSQSLRYGLAAESPPGRNCFVKDIFARQVRGEKSRMGFRGKLIGGRVIAVALSKRVHRGDAFGLSTFVSPSGGKVLEFFHSAARPLNQDGLDVLMLSQSERYG